MENKNNQSNNSKFEEYKKRFFDAMKVDRGWDLWDINTPVHSILELERELINCLERLINGAMEENVVEDIIITDCDWEYDEDTKDFAGAGTAEVYFKDDLNNCVNIWFAFYADAADEDDVGTMMILRQLEVRYQESLKLNEDCKNNKKKWGIKTEHKKELRHLLEEVEKLVKENRRKIGRKILTEQDENEALRIITTLLSKYKANDSWDDFYNELSKQYSEEKLSNLASRMQWAAALIASFGEYLSERCGAYGAGHLDHKEAIIRARDVFAKVKKAMEYIG